MTRSFVRVARPFAWIATAATIALAPAARAQVSLDDRIASLAEHVKKKADDQAVTVIEGLSQSFKSMTDDDKKKAVAAVEKCLSARRDDGDDKLFENAVSAFANMEDLGEKATIKNLKSPNVEKRRAVLAAAIRSLAFHKNPANVKTLTDFLVNSEPVVVAGAAEGLGNYADRPEKERKPIVEELVKTYATYSSAASNAQATPPQKATAKERLAIVEHQLQTSLQKLTGQEFKDAPAAQKWYNDNKSKKWPDPAAGGADSGAPAKN